jgi:hypothetical protein
MSRWVELSFIEDCKTLHKYGLNEYYDKANRGLYEFLSPGLSYKYELYNATDGQKMWKVEKQNNDPQFLVTLKNSKAMGDGWLVLDFYFFETGFDKQSSLEGKNYLDTLTKIVKDEIIPYFSTSDKTKLYFNAYTGDGAGTMRKNLFKRIIDKFMDKNVFNIEIRNQDFIITKKQQNKLYE